MDCEKFESTLLDELYDELDEVTSAAAKRHVAGCSRCASLLSGLKATRRTAVLPIVEPPADLEERIFAAAREAHKVVPLRSRASRIVARAGSWAMRPQSGMAAVFLLCIGLSALLLQGKHAAPPATVTVSEQGEPVASVTTETLARPPTAAAPVAAASAMDKDNADGIARSRAAGAAPVTPGHINAPAKSMPLMDNEVGALGNLGESSSAAGPSGGGGGAPQRHALGGFAQAPAGYGAPTAAAPMAPAPPPAARAQDESMQALKSAPYPAADQAQPQAQPLQTSPPSFASAKAAYDSGDYAVATTLFDSVAAGGDLKAALWAARSVRESVGCSAAVSRFDQVASAGPRTREGYDATLEGGRCYKQLGQSEGARRDFDSLLTVPAYVDRAKSELASMGPRAATKAAKPAQQAPAATQQAY